MSNTQTTNSWWRYFIYFVFLVPAGYLMWIGSLCGGYANKQVWLSEDKKYIEFGFVVGRRSIRVFSKLITPNVLQSLRGIQWIKQ